jgi:hypothetical protein
MMEAALVENLLLQGGELLNGDMLSEAELIQRALERSCEKPVCVVREWMLLDVMVSNQNERLLAGQGLLPTVLFARDIVFDSRTLGARPGALRSGFKLSFVESVFETRDVIYVLAGAGQRKHASLPAVLALDGLG